MNSIDEILIELIFKHNCVVVPKFGGFVAKKIPSKIDFKLGLIYPPQKHILFNPNLNDDDGLLKYAMCNKFSITFDEAEKKLEEIVSKWNKILDQGEHVEIKEFGALSKDNSERYIFIQDDYSNHLPSSFGLKELAFEPLDNEEIDLSKEQPIEQKKRNVRWIVAASKYAALFILTLLVFYSYWIPSHTQFMKSGVISWSDLNPFTEQKDPVHAKKNLNVEKPYKEEERSNVEMNKGIGPSVKKNEDERIEYQEIQNKPSIDKEEKTDLNFKIKVVVGCFAEKKYVDKFMERLKISGFDPFSENHGKLTRVCIIQTNDVNEAKKYVNKSKELGYRGWILKR